jgi:hypothetical protein
MTIRRGYLQAEDTAELTYAEIYKKLSISLKVKSYSQYQRTTFTYFTNIQLQIKLPTQTKHPSI